MKIHKKHFNKLKNASCKATFYESCEQNFKENIVEKLIRRINLSDGFKSVPNQISRGIIFIF